MLRLLLRYLGYSFPTCPHCGSSNVEPSSLPYQPVVWWRCNNCGGVWQEGKP